jgi:hypothetical protein
MSDKKEEQPTNSGNTKSIQTIPATRPTSVAPWKRWHFRSRIILMLLAAVAVIVYLMRSGLAKEYEGLGAALCAVACGGFLVWHAIHLFAEQDKFDEQQLNQATGSSPLPNPVENKQT